MKTGEGNWTRFLVLGRGEEKMEVEVGMKEEDECGWKGLLTLSLPVPAAISGTAESSTTQQTLNLTTLLPSFITHNVPITKIESRPSGRRIWEYVYVVEFRIPGEGGKQDAEKVVRELVRDLRRVVGERNEDCVRVWGVWSDGWGSRSVEER